MSGSRPQYWQGLVDDKKQTINVNFLAGSTASRWLFVGGGAGKVSGETAGGGFGFKTYAARESYVEGLNALEAGDSEVATGRERGARGVLDLLFRSHFWWWMT